MKKVYNCAVSMIIMSLFFSSCSSGETDEIIVEKTKYEVTEEGGNVTIDVKSNVPYDVIITDNWIKKKNANTRGIDNSSLVLEVERNRSGDIRVGIVKLVYKAGGIEKTVYIHQAFTLKLSLQDKLFEFDEHGGEGSFSFSCNADVNLECNDWIELKEKSTEDDKVVQKFIVKKLDDRQQSREGQIELRNTKSEVIEVITIKQSNPLFILEDSCLEMYITEEEQLPLINETGVEVVWDSSDKSIVEVKDGIIKILKEGKAMISVSSSDGTHKDIIEVNAFDITSKFSVTFEDILDGTGNYRTVYTNCLFYNGSKRSITVTSLKVYSGEIPPEDSPLKPWVTEADKSLLGQMSPGETKGIFYSVNVIGSGGHDDDLTFEWTVEFNGNEYICRYPHHVHETW